MDYSPFTIVKATPAQHRRALDIHHPHWGVPRGITEIDNYYARESALNGQDKPWARDGKYTQWALVPRDDPETLDLLASCETYEKVASVLVPGEAAPTRDVCYGIASVFCNPEHRNKGYPRHLLSLLHYVLAPDGALPEFPKAWGAPPTIDGYSNAAFSVLYSDVGPTYYARCTKGASAPGWVPHNPGKRVWPVPKDAAATQVADGAEWLDYAALDKLGSLVSRRILRDMAGKGDQAKTRVVIMPDGGWLQIAAQRNKLSTKPPAEDEAFGLLLPAPAGCDQPFMTWSFDHDEGKLVVGHVSGDVPWAAAVAAAQRAGCSKIESWGDYGWDNDAGEFELHTHKSIPALAAYTLGEDEQVDWVYNEKFPWM